jgi:hypothetical protein
MGDQPIAGPVFTLGNTATESTRTHTDASSEFLTLDFPVRKVEVSTRLILRHNCERKTNRKH